MRKPAVILHLAGRLASGAVELLLPRHCVVTGRPLLAYEQGCISPEAARGATLTAADYCTRCGASQGSGVGVVEGCGRCNEFKDGFGTSEILAAGDYASSLRALCLALKFGGMRAAAIPLAAWMAQGLLDRGIDQKIDAVIAVPLHPFREFRRGYNQAELLARRLATALGKPQLKPLRRTRATERQALLDAVARRQNIAQAFSVRRRWSGRLQGRSVLLVDDVMTTGATIAEAARTLKKAGVTEVYAAVAARSTVGADAA